MHSSSSGMKLRFWHLNNSLIWLGGTFFKSQGSTHCVLEARGSSSIVHFCNTCHIVICILMYCKSFYCRSALSTTPRSSLHHSSIKPNFKLYSPSSSFHPFSNSFSCHLNLRSPSSSFSLSFSYTSLLLLWTIRSLVNLKEHILESFKFQSPATVWIIFNIHVKF